MPVKLQRLLCVSVCQSDSPCQRWDLDAGSPWHSLWAVGLRAADEYCTNNSSGNPVAACTACTHRKPHCFAMSC